VSGIFQLFSPSPCLENCSWWLPIRLPSLDSSYSFHKYNWSAWNACKNIVTQTASGTGRAIISLAQFHCYIFNKLKKEALKMFCQGFCNKMIIEYTEISISTRTLRWW
jgi:hypothetical protein